MSLSLQIFRFLKPFPPKKKKKKKNSDEEELGEQETTISIKILSAENICVGETVSMYLYFSCSLLSFHHPW